MILLKAEDITVGYTEIDILHNVTVTVRSGEIVSVIGPNGAGKSTLLKTVFGILKPRNGNVTLKEEDITGLRPDRIVRKGISFSCSEREEETEGRASIRGTETDGCNGQGFDAGSSGTAA